ncbi:UBN2 domain-containing protein [Abeliophyllum distichum]|uniref:UBN2 domain-containing protein n=1 Tax=Abeliophyllum distichum TaxID=126358 RepID=A0ABD1UMC7_9LAMI
MLRSLSEDWNSLRMLIENTKDVNTYPLEELYGTLMTYELNNVETKEKTRRSKEEMKEPPKKQIALKSTNDEGSSNTNMSDEELDDLVLLVKKWRGSNAQTKKKFSKKKALQATWDDSDEDDLEEDEVQEEIANMCFMAIEDEVRTNNNDSCIDLSTSYDEILEEFEKLVSKYSILNNKHAFIEKR